MLKKLALGISMAMAAVSASAAVLDFDHVQFTQFAANQSGSGYSLSNTNSSAFIGNPLAVDYPGYGGLLWSNNSGNNDFKVVKVDGPGFNGAPAGNGFANGVVSGSWVATNSGGSDVSFQSLAGGSKFNFDSTYLAAAWYNGLKVDITGYRDGVQVYSTTTGPLSFNEQLLIFNWTSIDKVMFHSQQNSGTVIDNQSTYNHAFVMDNLSISAVAAPVPEPEIYAMMLAGLGLMGFMGRRRKSAQA